MNRRVATALAGTALAVAALAGCGGASSAAVAPAPCATVTGQLVALAHQLQASGSVVTDMTDMSDAQLELIKDALHAPHALAMAEYQMTDDLSSFNAAEITADASAIHALCPTEG